jgi:hypothetical protein
MQFDELYGERLNLELNNSDSNVLYTSTRRQQAVNDGYREFAALTECWQRRSTITVSCNVAEYVLSTITDFARVSPQGLPEFRLTSSGSSGTTTILAGDDFPRRDEIWQNRYESGWRQSTTLGLPRSWYLRNDGGQQVLGLDIGPDVASSETARLVIPYIARPEPMTASTAVPFTDTNGRTRVDLIEYHQAPVHYAAYKLLPLIGDTDGANSQLQKFLAYVTRFLQNSRPKGGTHVTMARSYLRDARRQRAWDAEVPTAPNYWR